MALFELAHFHQGTEAIELISQAVSKLEMALQINPKKHDALWFLGNALTSQGFLYPDAEKANKYFLEAAECYRRAVAEEPENEMYKVRAFGRRRGATSSRRSGRGRVSRASPVHDLLGGPCRPSELRQAPDVDARLASCRSAARSLLASDRRDLTVRRRTPAKSQRSLELTAKAPQLHADVQRQLAAQAAVQQQAQQAAQAQAQAQGARSGGAGADKNSSEHDYLYDIGGWVILGAFAVGWVMLARTHMAT